MGLGLDLYPDETIGMVLPFVPVYLRPAAGEPHRTTIPGAIRPEEDIDGAGYP